MLKIFKFVYNLGVANQKKKALAVNEKNQGQVSNLEFFP